MNENEEEIATGGESEIVSESQDEVIDTPTTEESEDTEVSTEEGQSA